MKLISAPCSTRVFTAAKYPSLAAIISGVDLTYGEYIAEVHGVLYTVVSIQQMAYMTDLCHVIDVRSETDKQLD